jgi:ethanolamine ammonia-lyase large subunit
VADVDGSASAVDAAARLYSIYAKAGGDRRTGEALIEEGTRTLRDLRLRGFDLGYEPRTDASSDPDARVDAIYLHARRALYASIDEGVLTEASPRYASVRTRASDRDDYLGHPPRGEQLRDEDARIVAGLYSAARPEVQVVISDGLNANAFNEHGRALLPALRRTLADAGHAVGERDVVIRNGRVRAGYHVGGLVGATMVAHVIGERPGTGLNTLSAYLTYGLDESGEFRWRTALDHACTTAICGIHPRGMPVDVAVGEIARTVVRILDKRCSGIALYKA